MCKLRFFVQASSYNASIAILTAITIERYFAIIHPMQSKRMTSLCLLKAVVFCIWVFAAATGSPLIVLYDVTESSYCSPRRDLEYYLKIYVTLSFVFLYVIPLLVMLVIYTRISIVLWKTSKPDGLTRNTVAGNSSAKSTRAFLKPSKGKLVSFSKTIVRLDDTRYEPVGSKDPRNCNSSSDESRKKDDLMGKNGNAMQNTSDEDQIMTMGDEPSDDVLEADDYENDWPTKRGSPPDGMKLYRKTVPANSDPENPDGTTRIAAKRMTQQEVNKKVQGRRQNALTARRKVVRLLIAVVLAFTLCLLPHHVDSLTFYWGPPRSPTFLRFLWTAIIPIITYSNNGLNPLLYAFLSENFRKSLYETICCRHRRSRHHRSMRSTTSVKTNNTTL